MAGEKSRADYDALCEVADTQRPGPAGKNKGGTDYVGALSAMFRDYAMAVEEHEEVRLDATFCFNALTSSYFLCRVHLNAADAAAACLAVCALMTALFCLHRIAPMCMGPLVVTVSSALTQVVRSSFGPAAVGALVLALQAECDTHGTRLLQRYSEVHLVDNCLVQQYVTRACC